MGLDLANVKRWADEIRSMTDDQETFLDTLDGQTDAIEVLRRVVIARQEAAAQEAATKDLAAQYVARAKRLGERQTKLTEFMGEILDAIGDKKIALDIATVSRSAGQQRVEIEDETQIPTQLMRVKSSPDAAAIKAQLKAGVDVPGARLVEGNKSVTVRIK